MKREAERREPWKLLTNNDPLWPFLEWPFRRWPFSSNRPSGQVNDDVGKRTGENLRCLWLMGPANLLHPDTPKIAIIGTRHPRPDIEEHIRRLARKIAERGYVIVSGFAPGIDRAAFEGALDSETGRTIAVLAEGIDWQRLPRRLRDIQRDPRYRSRVLIVSPFSPSTPWSGKNAMLRNLLIVALANIVIVGQAGPEETPREQSNRPRKSGTWHAVRKANEIRRHVIVPQSSLSVDHSQELVERRLAVAWAEDLSELERLMSGSNAVRSDALLVTESAFRTPVGDPSPVSHACSPAPLCTTQPIRNPGERTGGATDKAHYQQAALPGTCEGVAARQKDERSDDTGAERRSE
ncbi:DNA-processing protein DprA [Thermomicrobium sp. 4228-Ro]|uniref:DNA-processing protein DprA n=1 Tax=Thermomicrobium sp. 4228-Ro TaxID=2993937 RepID=UPI0022497D6A|nr:DNA-processing protein DprA [Thermomicrobium sp. 4228-Ro]MCX2726972.1 DNA-processing protein DprA [Thermomicrobium sp. 4228-Ro]